MNRSGAACRPAGPARVIEMHDAGLCFRAALRGEPPCWWGLIITIMKASSWFIWICSQVHHFTLVTTSATSGVKQRSSTLFGLSRAVIAWQQAGPQLVKVHATFIRVTQPESSSWKCGLVQRPWPVQVYLKNQVVQDHCLSLQLSQILITQMMEDNDCSVWIFKESGLSRLQRSWIELWVCLFGAAVPKGHTTGCIAVPLRGWRFTPLKIDLSLSSLPMEAFACSLRKLPILTWCMLGWVQKRHHKSLSKKQANHLFKKTLVSELWICPCVPGWYSNMLGCRPMHLNFSPWKLKVSN